MALHRATGEKTLPRPGRARPSRRSARRLPRTRGHAAHARRSPRVSRRTARPDRIDSRALGDGALAPVPAQVVTARPAWPRNSSPLRSRDRGGRLRDIKEGWHIYANPTGVEILKPTTLALEPVQPSGAFEVSYPKGQAKVLGSLGKEKVSLYEGKIEIPCPLDPGRAGRPGKVGSTSGSSTRPATTRFAWRRRTWRSPSKSRSATTPDKQSNLDETIRGINDWT